MHRSGMNFSPQEGAGLDMFVGSGLDFLSEVTFDDLQMIEPGSSDLFPNNLRPEPVSNYAPMAASLGPPRAVLPFSGFVPPYMQPQPYAADYSGLQPQPGALPINLVNTQGHCMFSASITEVQQCLDCLLGNRLTHTCTPATATALMIGTI